MFIDPRLVSILTPLMVQQSGATSQGSSTLSPPLLLGLPPGSILSGFIVNRDPAGNPIVRTETGDVAFQTQFFLKIGSEVVIRIENRAKSTVAHLLSVDGLPPEVATHESHLTDQPDVVFSRTLQNQGGEPPAAAARGENTSPAVITPSKPSPALTATLLPPADMSRNPNQPSLSPQLLSLRVISIAPQAPATIQSTSSEDITPPPTPKLYAVYARSSAAAISPPASTPVQTPAPQANMPVLPVDTPSEPASAKTTPTPQTMNAQVIAAEPDGKTLLNTPLGLLRVHTTDPLPKGSAVTLQILPGAGPLPAMPEAMSAVMRPVPAPISELAQGWESIEKIASLLLSLPEAGTPPWLPVIRTANLVARPPVFSQNLSTGLLFFITALRGGDFAGWLGEDNIRALKKAGHEALVQKAGGEFASMARLMNESAQQPGQWQAVFFPVAVDGQIELLRLFVKRDRRKQKRDLGKDEQDTRFVVEMQLSQLGDMQLDGFVRRQPGRMDFDLYIRSHSPFSESMQQDIAAIYNHIGQLTGYQGHLIFQAVETFPVSPMNELPPVDPGEIIA